MQYSCYLLYTLLHMNWTTKDNFLTAIYFPLTEIRFMNYFKIEKIQVIMQGYKLQNF